MAISVSVGRKKSRNMAVFTGGSAVLR